MRKSRILGLLLLLLCFSSKAQNFPGFNTGNFAGALSTDANPAFLADNMYKFDLTLVGASAFVDNNYGQLTYDRPFDWKSYEGLAPRTDKTRYGYSLQEIRGPSFMMRLSALDAFAFSSRLRMYENIDDLTPELANTIVDEFQNPNTFEEAFLNQGGSTEVMSWQEYSLTYSKVVQYRDEHFWKAGVTLKVLSGMGSGYADFQTFDYEIDTAQVISIDNVNLDFGHSNNFNGVSATNYKFKSAGGLSFGFDIGIVYERRPQEKFIPTFGNRQKKASNRIDRPYTYRLGISIIDIGRIRYNYGETSASADEITFDGSIDLGDKFTDINNGQELLDSLSTFLNIQPLTGKYTIGLPTTLQVNFDYNLHHGFYVNANVVASLEVLKFSDYNVHELSNLTITPRFENDWFGAYVPVYVNARGQANLGAAMRIGPLVVGVHDILPITGRNPFESAGVFVALKTFTLQKNRHKSELQCKDLYDGWKSRKKDHPRERKNYGDSPDLEE